MRRIISLLVIARLIQRLINGSRRPGGFNPGQGNRPARPQQGNTSAAHDEPPQGGATPASNEPPQGGPARDSSGSTPNSNGSQGSEK